MAGIDKVRVGNDDVYEAVGTGAIEGGNLVIPSTNATVNPGVQGIDVAGATATNVLGVAARRAEKASLQNLAATDGDGYPVTYPNPVNELTAVYRGCVVNVVYTAVAVAFGVKLKSAANGQVAAWVSGTDSPAAIVGECRVVGGMGSGGGKGLALIY